MYSYVVVSPKLRRYIRVIWTVGWSECFLKYHHSFGGYFLSFGTFLLRFFVIAHVMYGMSEPSIPFYGFYLFIGLVVWEFFTSTAHDCIIAPLKHKNLIER